MKTGRPPVLREAILAACVEGLTTPEATKRLGGGAVVRKVMSLLRQEGLLHTAGTPRRLVYFTHQADAEAYAAKMPTPEELKAIHRERARVYEQRYLEKVRASRPPKEPKPPAEPKPKAAKPKHGPALTVVKPKAALPAPVVVAKPIRRQDVPIIIPDHVQIQRCPSFEDTRFAADPSVAGRGQITADWAKRHARQASRYQG